MDATFFKPFVDGTLHTLKLQCSIEAKLGKPYIKSTAQSPACDIAGIIGLSSTTFTGTISLCFPKPVFLEIMSKMFGEPMQEITDDLTDGAAELLNIIFGQAKKVLNDGGCDLEKAIPTVIRGENMQTRQLSKNPTVVLPFQISSGVFNLEISKE